VASRNTEERRAARPGSLSESRRYAPAWLRARARLAPESLIQSPPWVRSVFDRTWAPMEALAQQIDPLPQHLWRYLLQRSGGFVSIGRGESRYVPGPGSVRHRPVHNVALVSAKDLAERNERPLHVIGHLIDHYLGCGGIPDGPWLSAGKGMTATWQQAGARLLPLFDLGYGVDEVAQADVRDYFAQSLAIYCLDRQRLNVADPQIYKWFRSTLWDEAFWRAQEEEEG
jgi:hypothetical protein